MEITKLEPKDYNDGYCQNCKLQAENKTLEADKKELVSIIRELLVLLPTSPRWTDLHTRYKNVELNKHKPSKG